VLTDIYTELQIQYQSYKNNLQAVAGKIGDVEQEAEEHKCVGNALFRDRTLSTVLTCNRLVLETLEPLPEDRKCFRMINGVLVERTIKDVKPALQTNSDGLKKVLDDLVKQYKSIQDEMEKWKVGDIIRNVLLHSTLIDTICRRRTMSKSFNSDLV